MKKPPDARNPLRGLLASLRDRRAGRDPNGDAIGRGLAALADRIGALIRTSDARRGPVSSGDAQQLAALDEKQKSDIASLRDLAKEAPTIHRAGLPRLARKGRGSLLDVCRAQVRKLRLSRSADSDVPGGES